MIANIHYQKLRIVEFIQFLNNSISICKKNDPVALEIDTTLAPLEESLGNIEAVFNKERGSNITEEIAAKINAAIMPLNYSPYMPKGIADTAPKRPNAKLRRRSTKQLPNMAIQFTG